MARHRLHYVPNASSLAPHVALTWAGSDFEPVQAAFGDKLLYELNPIGTVAILERDDGFVLPQTPAILRYISSIHPEAELGGEGTIDSDAEINKWLSFLSSDVHPSFHLLFIPDRYAIDGNEGAREAALALCYRNFGVLEDHLQDNEWMSGERKSILDAYMLPVIRWSYVQFPPEKRTYERINQLHDALIADPGVHSVMETEGIVDAISR